MDAASISVIASGLVALASVVATYRTGQAQRRHEAALAYDSRSWDQRSEALFEVIATIRTLMDALTGSERARHRLIFKLTTYRRQLRDQVPRVEAYASDQCRNAFNDFLYTLDDARGGPDVFLLMQKVDGVRAKLDEAIDNEDFELAAARRAEEQNLMRAAYAKLDLDERSLLTLGQRAVDAARADLKGA